MTIEMIEPPVDRDYGTFANWVQQALVPRWVNLDEIGRAKALTINYDGRRNGFWFRAEQDAVAKMSPMSQDVAVGICQTGNVADAESTYGLVQLVSQGIKIYKPSVAECEALENISPSIPAEDYRQPFDTFVVEYPRDYNQKRIVQGCLLDGRAIDAYPLGTIVTHCLDQRGILFVTILQSGMALTFLTGLDNDRLLSESLQVDFDRQFGKGNYSTFHHTAEEAELGRQTVLISVNAALLLCKYNARKIGPANPRYYQKLLDRLRRNKEHRAVNQMHLNQQPVYYGFDQTIRLYDEEKEPSEERSSTGGWSVKPHWRSGHWRRQAGYREIEATGQKAERVFIKPILVNAHLLHGPLSATKVTMTT